MQLRSGPTVQANIPIGYLNQSTIQLLSKAFYRIDFGLKWFSCSSTRTDCMQNISMTHYTSFCISRLCPLQQRAAYTTGINHFPASLLHEMKESIMVTVGHCEALAVIYLVEIDWFINTEWTVLGSVDGEMYLATCHCTCWKNVFSAWRS